MRLVGPDVWGRPQDGKNMARVLRLALELGVTFIDTADAYGPEVNEEQIAETLHPYPAELVIATKGGVTRQGPGSWEPDCRPERLKKCCEASLKRLKVDRIDLYQLHAVDPRVPYAEQVGALAELQREGKIRHIGLSNVDTKHLDIAHSIAPIVSVQNCYNIADRKAESVLAECVNENETTSREKLFVRPAEVIVKDQRKKVNDNTSKFSHAIFSSSGRLIYAASGNASGSGFPCTKRSGCAWYAA
jgi:pyridoxine 4-dehydrogenase